MALSLQSLHLSYSLFSGFGPIFEEPDSNKETNPSLKADQIISDPSTGKTKTAGANPLPEAKAGKNSHYPDSNQFVDVLDGKIRLAIETEILEMLCARRERLVLFS